MSEKQVFRLVHQTARNRAIETVAAAPDGYVVEVKEPTRTSDQNAKLHAMLQDISRQTEWAGKKRTLEDWKALVVSAHRIALQQAGEVVPGLEGEFVQLRKSTAAMGVRELASLIEYVTAWGTTQGVCWTEQYREAA